MSRNYRRHVLVTGSNRSGTTWVGEMLKASGEMSLLYEPFNIARQRALGIKCPLKHHFQYVTPQDSVRIRSYIDHCLASSTPHWPRDAGQRRSLRRLLGSSYRLTRRWATRRVPKRVIIKDPIALFAAPWFAENYGCHVLVLIRHPAAYVASIKRVGWRTDLGDLLKQDELVRRYLEDMRDEIAAFRPTVDNIIEEATLRWRIYHHVIGVYQREYPWWFVRHEDLCRAPVPGFARLYQAFDLRFSDSVRSAVLASTHVTVEPELGGKTHVLTRDSKSLVKRWKTALTPEEIGYVREHTRHLSSVFYSAEDW